MGTKRGRKKDADFFSQRHKGKGREVLSISSKKIGERGGEGLFFFSLKRRRTILISLGEGKVSLETAELAWSGVVLSRGVYEQNEKDACMEGERKEETGTILTGSGGTFHERGKGKAPISVFGERGGAHSKRESK